MVQIFDIPLWLRFSLGYLEGLAILWFIISVCSIRIKFKRLILLNFFSTTIILLLRYASGGNIFIYVTASIISNYVLIYFFTGAKGWKTLTSIVLSYVILFLVEPLGILLGLQLHHLNPKAVWFITGLPHIFIFLSITLVFRKVKDNAKKNKGKTL